MAGKGDYLEAAVLNAVFRGVTFPVIATVYVALMSVNVADDGTGGTEAAYGGYARVAITSSTANWKDPTIATIGQTNNSNKLVWPVNIGPSAETEVGIAIYDAPTGGNLLYWLDTTDITAKVLDQPYIDVNLLVVSED